MLGIAYPIFWLIGAIALAAGWFWVRGHFGAEARARRRRERSNRPAISRKRGPTVKLAVNMGKSKGDRER